MYVLICGDREGSGWDGLSVRCESSAGCGRDESNEQNEVALT